jgi:putative ABC transport system permease protein
MILLATFAALALGLAAVGIYGLVAYTVSQRTSEIGIRVALGARTSAVLTLVAGEGIRSVAAGLVAGVAGALALTHVLGTMLFGIGSRDAVAFLAAAGVLVLAAAAATVIPALRATRIDPAGALRCQ